MTRSQKHVHRELNAEYCGTEQGTSNSSQLYGSMTLPPCGGMLVAHGNMEAMCVISLYSVIHSPLLTMTMWLPK